MKIHPLRPGMLVSKLAVGHVASQAGRETGSMLSRIALWDCFRDAQSLFYYWILRDCAGKDSITAVTRTLKGNEKRFELAGIRIIRARVIGILLWVKFYPP